MPKEDQVRPRVDLIPIRLSANIKTTKGDELLWLHHRGVTARREARVNSAPGPAILGRARVRKTRVLQEEARVTLKEAQDIRSSLWNDIAGTVAISREILWLKLWEVFAICRAIRAV
jgi:hypothetical protein